MTGLIAVEAALSVVLLAGAGLLIRSFSKLVNEQPGFRPQNVLTVQIPAPWEDVARRPNDADVERRKQYLHDVAERMRTLPGVTAAGIVTTLPLGPVNVQTRIFIEGRPTPGPGEDIRILYRGCNPDYFRAMGIPILRGRTFDDGDRTGRPQVVIVNQAMARRYWPGEDAVGRQLSFAGPNGPWATVAGVAGDVRQNGLDAEPVPEIYTSIVQTILGPQISTIVLRTSRDPASLGPLVRTTIRQMNPGQPIADVKTMEQLLTESAARPRLYTVLLAVFAALAVVLAAAGIFSAISWTVSQSTREIGIRMAMGATPGKVLAVAMRRALLATAAGTVLGIAGAVPLTRVLKTQLHGVTANDPTTFVSVPLVLIAVAALAAYLPARRATRVDPVTALR